jgi:hypothetical protein
MSAGLPEHDAADRLTTGMRSKKCLLWCDGQEVPVHYIATSLVVVAREKDGNADVVSSRGEAWRKGPESYAFEFDAEEVKALLRPTPTSQPTTTSDYPADDKPRRKPGTKAKDDWPLLVAAKLIYMARYDPEALENVDALIKPMKEFLQDEIGWAPKDPKQVREKIVFLLRLVRP